MCIFRLSRDRLASFVNNNIWPATVEIMIYFVSPNKRPLFFKGKFIIAIILIVVLIDIELFVA